MCLIVSVNLTKQFLLDSTLRSLSTDVERQVMFLVALKLELSYIFVPQLNCVEDLAFSYLQGKDVRSLTKNWQYASVLLLLLHDSSY